MPPNEAPQFWSAWVCHLEAETAAVRAAEQVVRRAAGTPIDVVFVFVSAPLAPASEVAIAAIHDRLHPKALIGVSTAAVISDGIEFEREPAVSILAASLPGCLIHTFSDRDVPAVPEPLDQATIDELRRAVFPQGREAVAMLLVDPYSVPMHRLLPAFNAARPNAETLIVGGMASGGDAPGQCAVYHAGQVRRHGFVGVSIAGPITAHAIVSQGCRPIGQPMVITKAKGNVILGLGGLPALDVVRETIDSLSESDAAAARTGLMIGRVVSEYRDRFGRDDFLIRNLLGAEETTSAIAVSDLVRVGQTVQFHIRDPRTAKEDLALLLDAQQLHAAPLGGVLVTCERRGSGFFGTPNHDAAKVARAFASTVSAERRAKGGVEIDPQEPTIPIAGFYASSEIGPIAGAAQMHSQTACLLLFRPKSD